jgi:DnaK suppressor protein
MRRFSLIAKGEIPVTDHTAVKKNLQAQLEELLQRAAGIEESLNNPGNSDWEENAVESQDDEVLAGVGTLTRNEIKEIRLALNLIETGQYGKCTACGGEIGRERLAAMPYTTKCIKCA